MKQTHWFFSFLLAIPLCSHAGWDILPPLPICTMSDMPWWQTPNRNRHQEPDPPHCAPLDVRQLQSEVLPDHWAPAELVEGEASLPAEKPHFSRLCPRSLSVIQHSELVTIGEGQDEDWLLKSGSRAALFFSSAHSSAQRQQLREPRDKSHDRFVTKTKHTERLVLKSLLSRVSSKLFDI